MVAVRLINSTVAELPLGLPDQTVTGLVDTTGFQSSPNFRGTLTIVFACASALSIAIINSFHPHPWDTAKGFDWDTLLNEYILPALAPEFLVFRSVTEYKEADKVTSEFRQDLGLSRWTSVHSFVLSMNGFALVRQDGTFEPNPSSKRLKSLIEDKILKNEDLPTADEVMETSRASHVTKVLAVVQILWVIIQCIARSSQRLSVTLLELLTCGYIVCGVLSYLFWLHKPYRMDSRPIIIYCSGAPRPLTVVGIIRRTIKKLIKLFTCFRLPAIIYGYAACIFTILVLSVIHLSAWNYVFPSKVERHVWHVTTILHILTVIFLFFLVGLNALFCCCGPFKVTAGAVHVLLVLFRIILIILAIISLRSLPAGAYIQPAWTYYLPHVQ
ncbi:hypothetical protein DL96DRAFT_588449 [Flagelloscypha sp. PMI_526]|nr:hypothetical protein DL96DRAFT_588449 [Flagelloscypha sp. PMI_526]